MTRWLIKIKKRYETIIKLKLYSHYADSEGFDCHYGFVIHDRRRSGKLRSRKVRITRDKKALPNPPKQEGHF